MGAVDEITKRHGDDKIGAAKEIGVGLVRGNKVAGMEGYSPKYAMCLALLVVGHYSTVDEILDRHILIEEIVHTYLLGFHDALLKDKKGYKITPELGFEYESGHRLGGQEKLEDLFFSPREQQLEDTR